MAGHEDLPPLEDDPALRELARRIGQLLGVVHRLASDVEARPSLFARRLAEHLGVDPLGLPVASEEIPPYQLIDVQVALERWAVEPGRSSELVGVSGRQRRFHPLAEMLDAQMGIDIGPVEYQDLPDSPTTTRACVRFGVWLLRDGDEPLVLLLRNADPHGPMQSAMLEVLARDEAAARALLRELRELAVEHSVIRGQVLALGPGEGQRYGHLRFVARPALDRDALVLPDGTLARIERHVVGMAVESRRLREAGQHLKRGVLLYGPPGTGKTHTVRYLLGRRPATTCFVLSGQALGLVAQACTLARAFQPSMVVLEDVDLIGGDRSLGAVGSNPLLFEVLNQIDGLGDDVDVTFVLTTNRVDILERALAERPGRVDAAIEIAAPDAIGRRKLLRLYGARLGVDRLGDADLEDTVEITEGRTATYLREVVRRAALLAAESSDGPLVVDGPTLAGAAAELVETAGALAEAMAAGDLGPGTGVVGGPGGVPVGGPGGASAGAVLRPAGGGGGAYRSRLSFRRGSWSAHGPGGDEPPPFVPDDGPAS